MFRYAWVGLNDRCRADKTHLKSILSTEVILEATEVQNGSTRGEKVITFNDNTKITITKITKLPPFPESLF